MVSPSSKPESPAVSGVRLSSVVPGKETGHKEHQLSNMDLALKLHYIKAVYFFELSTQALEGLTIYELKKPMFELLQLYFTASGRIRKSQGGRPFIKCNDGGVRIVEAFCDKNIDEWLAINHDSRDNCLAYHQVLGPDLGFSPLVFVQFTWFKSGGMSLGLSWAHVLGDPISASNFINAFAQIMAGHVPSKSLYMPNPSKSKHPNSVPSKLFAMKRVDPVDDYWRTPNNCDMETHTFRVTAKQLNHIVGSVCAPANVSNFEVLSAVIWKSLSKVREDSGPRAVTICTYNNSGNRGNEMPANDMVLTIVEADFNLTNGDITELAVLLADRKMDGNIIAEEISEKDSESSDFIVYGANLTFVNMEGADVYGLKLKGQRPMFVNYTIDGVGDEGIVLVLLGQEEAEGGCGRTMTVVLPANQIAQLKKELGREWGIV